MNSVCSSAATFARTGTALRVISTVAPTSVSLFLMASASALETPLWMGFCPASTRSFASLRPRPVIWRTTLMRPILLAPASARRTVNSVCSSAAAFAGTGASARAFASASARAFASARVLASASACTSARALASASSRAARLPPSCCSSQAVQSCGDIDPSRSATHFASVSTPPPLGVADVAPLPRCTSGSPATRIDDASRFT